MLNVKCLVTGELEENCYIINLGIKALIIDPGDNSDKIIKYVKDNKLEVEGILLTHHHFDHVGALDDVRNEFKKAKFVDYNNSGDIKIEPFHFKIIETYGHTLDSVSFYFDKYNTLFTGDFVFKGTIGNYDYDNEDKMIKSLKIFKYMPKDVVVYPGHGESTTVGDELKNNPFLKGI